MRFFLKYILIWILLLVSISAISQGFKKKFIDAEYHYMFEEFSEALPIYLEISNSQPDNANINYRIGICYLHLPDPKENEKALPYLQKAITNINPKYKEGSYLEKGAPKDAFFYLGNAYRNKLDFDNAIESYKKYRDILNSKEVFYIDYIDREIQCTQNAKELVKLPLQLKFQNLDDEINSQTNQINSPIDVENCPVVSDNETVFVFTAGNKNVFSSEIDLNIINADYKMDNICFSKKTEGKWTEPKNITRQLGAKSRVVPVTISADGTELYLVRDDNDNGNIYISHYKNDRWTKMEPLNKNINTKNWESHATITVDGKTLYFTSDRKGGFGRLDIYRSDRDEKGDWGPAVNLGSTINTKYDEETPIILNDSKTMYFSSQGHYCMGGFDAFYTTLLANNTWSAPLNVGYPINTVGNDLFYIPKDDSEILLGTVSGGVFTPDAQMYTDFNSFVANDEYLSANRGKISERNGATNPWVSYVDLHIAQEVPIVTGHKLVLSLDIENLMNLINSDWGENESVFSTFSIVDRRGTTSSGRNVYRFTSPSNNTPFTASTFSSRWQMQLGVRYTF